VCQTLKDGAPAHRKGLSVFFRLDEFDDERAVDSDGEPVHGQ
jgi:hypothetical protein